MTFTTASELSTPYPVRDVDVDAFAADGHLLLRHVLADDEVENHREGIRRTTLRLNNEDRPLAERDTYGKAFLQVFNLWRHDADVARFVRSDRLARIAAELLCVDRVRIYHDQALFKEAGGGGTPWHQDARYWPLDGNRCITLWIPLVDVPPTMGGLAFASGSHLDRQLGDLGISDASDAFFSDLLAGGGYPVSGPVAMRAGDVSAHSGWTLHRALPNDSDVLREVMTVIYFADGLSAEEPRNDAQRQDLERWLPGVLPGQVAASTLNPALPARGRGPTGAA